MIDFIKQWENQIIVAIIIATIFEMILPNSNNKKYIKMIIGIYVFRNMPISLSMKIYYQLVVLRKGMRLKNSLSQHVSIFK